MFTDFDLTPKSQTSSRLCFFLIHTVRETPWTHKFWTYVSVLDYYYWRPDGFLCLWLFHRHFNLNCSHIKAISKDNVLIFHKQQYEKSLQFFISFCSVYLYISKKLLLQKLLMNKSLNIYNLPVSTNKYKLHPSMSNRN